MRKILKQVKPFKQDIVNDRYVELVQGDKFYCIVKNACFNYCEFNFEDDLAGLFTHSMYRANLSLSYLKLFEEN